MPLNEQLRPVTWRLKAAQRRAGGRLSAVRVALMALQKSKICGTARLAYTPIGYASEIVGRKRRNAPPLTHYHA
jgi:hypothetical protein